MANKKLIPETQIEEDKHWWFNTRTQGLLRLLDQYIGHGGDRLVLDVGCGAGNMIHHLSHYGRVVGVDNFEKPLIVCHRRGYQAHLASAEVLPYADNSFGLVTLLDVIEHCDDDLQVMRECYRVCTPGGYLAVTIPAFDWLWTDNDVINGHKRRYTAGQVRQLMQAVGFVPKRVSYAFFLVFPLAAGVLILRRLTGRRQKLAAPHQDEEAYQVEMEPVHPVLNATLDRLGYIEAALIARFDLPVGSSIIAIAQKPVSRTIA